MAVRGTRVSVGTTAVAILRETTGRSRGSGAVVKNLGTVDLDLGGPSVATGAGLPLPAGESISVELEPSESLWAVAASGTVSVALLEGGV
ncbi:MAG TPA: hypothetical protein VIG24_05925 [Acidimicrobiia bacterium]